MRYSALQLLKNGLSLKPDWPPLWRSPEPKAEYDVLIIGGGGHGLATAYYLAKNHGITNVAVLEKGSIGAGNVGRNTTIVRANYMLPANAVFYSHSLKLWEDLADTLNYNVMFSQRGVLLLGHSAGQMNGLARRGNTVRLQGDDAELLDRQAVQKYAPYLNFNNSRFPIQGGLLQRRAGTARHDAVTWGYARGADQRGVDILQNCEVTGFNTQSGSIQGVKTTRGTIRAGKIGMCVAGSSSLVGQMAGLQLPIESHVLQAFVTESVKPVLPNVVSFGMGHFYISQSNKGGLVFGGDIDGYNSYAQRGNLPMAEHVMEAGMQMMPLLGRSRVLRSWGGVMDMTMDGSPIIDRTPVDGLFFNGGWCYGGFKATPASGWSFAHLIATGSHDKYSDKFLLNRFETGKLIDEEGSGAQPNLH